MGWKMSRDKRILLFEPLGKCSETFESSSRTIGSGVLFTSSVWVLSFKRFSLEVRCLAFFSILLRLLATFASSTPISDVFPVGLESRLPDSSLFKFVFLGLFCLRIDFCCLMRNLRSFSATLRLSRILAISDCCSCSLLRMDFCFLLIFGIFSSFPFSVIFVFMSSRALTCFFAFSMIACSLSLRIVSLWRSLDFSSAMYWWTISKVNLVKESESEKSEPDDVSSGSLALPFSDPVMELSDASLE